MVQSYAVATFDLNLLPIHRVNGQELAELPGLMAVAPPRKTGRGREQDTLILYLMLSGNATLSSFELHDLLKNTAHTFHQTPGSLTSAMRKAAEKINSALLERNLSTMGRGLQAFGVLALAVIRNEQCTLLLSGPAHVVWVSDGKSRHIHDPALSGKGLGTSQSFQSYFSQVELHERDLLTLCGKFPKDWEADLLNERPPASLDASYRRLTMTQGDLNAVLIQAHSGHGTLTVLRPEAGGASASNATGHSCFSTGGSNGGEYGSTTACATGFRANPGRPAIHYRRRDRSPGRPGRGYGPAIRVRHPAATGEPGPTSPPGHRCILIAEISYLHS